MDKLSYHWKVKKATYDLDFLLSLQINSFLNKSFSFNDKLHIYEKLLELQALKLAIEFEILEYR